MEVELPAAMPTSPPTPVADATYSDETAADDSIATTALLVVVQNSPNMATMTSACLCLF